MIGFYSYTVILTYLSMVFAMAGIHLSFNGFYQWAFICLIICGICDTFDGMVARTKKGRTLDEKRFGIQIDSLCDLVAFGVFPAILGYNVGLESIGWLAIEIFFVIAAVIRLAYFNVKEETRQDQTNAKRKYYQGLPVTAVSFILPLAYAFRYVVLDLDYIYGALMLVCGVLFILDFKVPKIQIKGILALGVLVVIELIQIMVRS